MNAWSHLSNAPLIDWVLESVGTDPEKWAAARSAARATTHATTHAAARSAAWYAARSAARDTALDAALDAAWNAALDAAWNAALNAAAARNAARDAILVLIVYDDCDQYLQMSYEQLLAWAHLSEKPQAVLLLSLKWVQEHEAIET